MTVQLFAHMSKGEEYPFFLFLSFSLIQKYTPHFSDSRSRHLCPYLQFLYLLF